MVWVPCLSCMAEQGLNLTQHFQEAGRSKLYTSAAIGKGNPCRCLTHNQHWRRILISQSLYRQGLITVFIANLFI